MWLVTGKSGRLGVPEPFWLRPHRALIQLPGGLPRPRQSRGLVRDVMRLGTLTASPRRLHRIASGKHSGRLVYRDAEARSISPVMDGHRLYALLAADPRPESVSEKCTF
jgi:hypothetical protein